MCWTESYGEAKPKKWDKLFSLPVHVKCEFGEKEKEGLVNQKGDWPGKGESPEKGPQYLPKQYPRNVLADGPSILAIRPVCSLGQVIVTGCH